MLFHLLLNTVATALTVYGIETFDKQDSFDGMVWQLQQHLPFTVLKLNVISDRKFYLTLQQHLPFTVLKLSKYSSAYGMEAQLGCNSTYRLRY